MHVICVITICTCCQETYMDILIKTPFIQTLLKTTRHNVPERNQLENIFQDFALVVASVCDRADKKNALRILNYTQIEVQAICKQMEATGMPEYMMTYAIKAEQLIKAENKILYWNFKYPEQFVSCDDVVSSPLYWSKKYPAICLAELLCGINLLGPNPIVLADGSEASFNQIVIVFEKMLNVKLGDPQDIKRRVLNRKIHITRFTDALRFALRNYEENNRS